MKCIKQEYLRLIGVRVDNLIGKDEEQLSFFSNTSENSKQENLDKTIDKLNEKYGNNFITRAGKMDLENIVKFEPKQKWKNFRKSIDKEA